MKSRSQGELSSCAGSADRIQNLVTPYPEVTLDLKRVQVTVLDLRGKCRLCKGQTGRMSRPPKRKGGTTSCTEEVRRQLREHWDGMSVSLQIYM